MNHQENKQQMNHQENKRSEGAAGARASVREFDTLINQTLTGVQTISEVKAFLEEIAKVLDQVRSTMAKCVRVPNLLRRLPNRIIYGSHPFAEAAEDCLRSSYEIGTMDQMIKSLEKASQAYRDLRREIRASSPRKYKPTTNS